MEVKRFYFRVRQIHCDPIRIGEVRTRYLQVPLTCAARSHTQPFDLKPDPKRMYFSKIAESASNADRSPLYL